MCHVLVSFELVEIIEFVGAATKAALVCMLISVYRDCRPCAEAARSMKFPSCRIGEGLSTLDVVALQNLAIVIWRRIRDGGGLLGFVCPFHRIFDYRE